MGDFFVSAQELSGRMARGEALRVFDVRRRQAILVDSRFIPGSRWRNHLETADWIGQVSPGTPVILTCMHGHNVSQIAGAQLRDQGVDARVLAGGIDGWLGEGLPSVGQNDEVPFVDQAPSIWVTRLGAGVDRVACAWLIRRFIDPDAVIHFVEAEWVADVAEELGGNAFCMLETGPNFSFFDTILSKYDIKDPALDALSALIRGAQGGDSTLAPEVSGLIAISSGIAAMANDDQHALHLGLLVYDALYASARLTASKR